jgi:hypothetical protein
MLLRTIGFFLLCSSASAAVQKWPVKPQDRVKISLSKAQVTLLSTKESAVTFSSGAGCREVQTEAREGEFIIRETDLLKTQSEASACQVQIQVPSTPLQLHVLEGSILAQKPTSDLLLHVQKGRVALREGAGTATVHVQKGEVQVTDYQGRLRLDLQQAGAVVKGLQGELDLQSLGGDHLIEKAKGNLRVVQAQGSLKVTGGQGSLQLETVRSTLTTQAFAGRIEGQTQEGTLNLSLTAEPDVNLKSQAGRITLAVLPGSGAHVNLVTQEGDLFGPSFLPIAKEGTVKMIRGRLRGEASKGSLIVRSQEGSIVLK